MVRPLLLAFTRYGLWRSPIVVAARQPYLQTAKDPSSICVKCFRAQISTSGVSKSGLTKITKALTNRKLEFSERKVLRYPIELMYHVVNDVDRYSEFVPWCKKSEVLLDKGSIKVAKLEVGFGKVTEKYNSTVTCVRPHLVKSVCTDGKLFNSLTCIWRFAPGRTKNTCLIDFQVAFEFRSLLYSQLANVVFNEIVKTMVKAFEKRACQIQHSEKQSVKPT